MRLSDELNESLSEGKYPRLEAETDDRIDRLLKHLMSAEEKLKAAKREKWQAEQQIGTLEARIKHYKESIDKLRAAKKKLAKASTRG
jgi:chromosome segregation ATPase